jgi:hypothetical protein
MRRRLFAFIVEPVLDHLQGQEVLPLLAEDPTQAFHIVLVELPVPGRGPLGVDQALALEKPDLGDGDVGKLLSEQGEDVSYRQVRTRAHHLSPSPADVCGAILIRPSPPGTAA